MSMGAMQEQIKLFFVILTP